MRKTKKLQKGITLIALVGIVATLIIILAVSIVVIFGENRVNEINPEGSEEIDTNIETPTPPILIEYNDETLLSTPQVSEGMQRVKWDEVAQKWKKAEATDEWYNYAEKEWANVVLGEANIWNEDGTLNESKAYIQLVWIPRYAYKIKSMYHKAGTETTAGEIDIKFIDTNNKDAKGEKYETTYPSAETNGNMSDYVVHPAFDYGGTAIPGFWVGKFESSHSGCTTEYKTGEVDYNTVKKAGNKMTVKPGVTSWRYLSIGDMFQACLDLNNEKNTYGLSTDDTEVDPHLMKNSEWGAVAYLSKSSYGKNEEEIWINPNKNFITGQAGDSATAKTTETTSAYNTPNGIKASTTGNTTGVYDMSGGAWEYVAAFIEGAYDDYAGTMLQESTPARYVEKYPATYTACDPANEGKYGDAVWETSRTNLGSMSWYADFSNYPSSNLPFFIRGGGCYYASDTGVFCFSNLNGSDAVQGFRVVIPVLK